MKPTPITTGKIVALPRPWHGPTLRVVAADGEVADAPIVIPFRPMMPPAA